MLSVYWHKRIMQFIAIDLLTMNLLFWEAKQYILMILPSITLLIYFLTIIVRYTSENKLNNLTNHSDIIAGTYYPMFYYPKDKLFYSNNYSNYTELVICKDDVNIAWEITEETKNIDGYNCIKAIGKARNVYSKEEEHYSYEAWFAPELPYQYGPFNITGLPGLVVYANERNEKIFKLERIELNTTTSMDEFSLEPAREVTIYDLAKEHIEANEKFLNN